MLDIPTSNVPLSNEEYANNIDALRELHVIGVHDFGTFMYNFGVNSLQLRSFILAFYRYLGDLKLDVADNNDSVIKAKGLSVASSVAQGDYLNYEVQLLLSEGHDHKRVMINIVHVNPDGSSKLITALYADVGVNSLGATTFWQDGTASLHLTQN